VKGQAIYAFVTLSDEAGKAGDREQIKKALIAHIRSQIGELQRVVIIAVAIALAASADLPVEGS
jgi:acyl-coenzyme A synthetase/AMP-(fatty) acid ligase